MKRSTALFTLSREHHTALKVAQALVRVESATARDARDAFLAFMAREGEQHFQAEESILLPAVNGLFGAEDPDIERTLREHAEIRRRAAGLRTAPPDLPSDEQELRDLGKLLRDHVRHEERTLFPRIEEALDSNELRRLGEALDRAGIAPYC